MCTSDVQNIHATAGENLRQDARMSVKEILVEYRVVVVQAGIGDVLLRRHTVAWRHWSHDHSTQHRQFLIRSQ